MTEAPNIFLDRSPIPQERLGGGKRQKEQQGPSVCHPGPYQDNGSNDHPPPKAGLREPLPLANTLSVDYLLF